jgi:hypothetical protein
LKIYDGGRGRTYDIAGMNRLLYQLSYAAGDNGCVRKKAPLVNERTTCSPPEADVRELIP